MAKVYRQRRFEMPAGATDLLLARHGESAAFDPNKPFPMKEGQSDPELHEEGWHQARLLAARLQTEPIQAIYVSSLRRTLQTATPLAEKLKLTPQIDPDLREVHLGEWEGGMFRIKEHERDPVMSKKFHEEQRWDVIPGAESNDSLRTRLVAALHRIQAAHSGQMVLAVVHGGVIGHILSHATGARPFAFVGAGNASLTRIVLHQDRIIVRTFNDTTHLET